MPDALSTLSVANEDPGSPLWWLAYCNAKLEAERPDLDKYDNYYEGIHPLFFATPKFREAFGDLFDGFADNWCEVVVDAKAERLAVEGFRLDDGENGDRDVWDLWQRSGMDAESSAAMTEAIKLSRAVVLVEPQADGDPILTVEHPSQMIVVRDPGNRRRRLAAMKKWQDDMDGMLYATVYLPEGAYRFRSARPANGIAGFGSRWIPRDDAPDFVPYGPLTGTIPAVEILNDPTLLRGGRSDLKKVVPLQNAINKLANDLIVASEFSAFRQRLLTGVEVPRYPEGHPQAGEPMSEAFVSAVSRLLVVEEPDAKAQEFGASDLTNYVKAVEMFVQHLAAQTRTPPHYLMGTVVNASGDALKAAETGLVAKVRGTARYMGQGWEDVMRLALAASPDPAVRAKADAKTIETLWRDPENRSDAEVADAAVKLKQVGVPEEALWERVGASSAERERWAKMRQAELADAMAAALAGTRNGDQGLPNETPPAATGGTAPTGANATGGGAVA